MNKKVNGHAPENEKGDSVNGYVPENSEKETAIF